TYRRSHRPRQNAKNRCWHRVDHEHHTAIEPLPKSLHGRREVPTEGADHDQLEVRICLRLEDLPCGKQARMILAWLYGCDGQQVSERLFLEITGIKALLLP